MFTGKAGDLAVVNTGAHKGEQVTVQKVDYIVALKNGKTQTFQASSLDPVPSPAPIPPPVALALNADYSTSDFSQWDGGLQDTSTVGAAAVGQSDAKIVQSFRKGVKNAAQFIVTKNSNTATRAEVGTNSLTFGEGDEYWFGWSQLVPSVPNQADGWGNTDFEHHTIAQLGKPIGSPPPQVGVTINRLNGQIAFYVDLGNAGQFRLGDCAYDTTYDFAPRVRYSKDAKQGQVEFWINGKQVYSNPAVQTLDSSGVRSYLKSGLYSQGTSSLMVENAAFAAVSTKTGGTRGDVDPSVRFAAA